MFEVYKMMGTDFEGNAVLAPEDPHDEYERLQANLSVADEFQGYGEDGRRRIASPSVSCWSCGTILRLRPMPRSRRS